MGRAGTGDVLQQTPSWLPPLLQLHRYRVRHAYRSTARLHPAFAALSGNLVAARMPDARPWPGRHGRAWRAACAGAGVVVDAAGIPVADVGLQPAWRTGHVAHGRIGGAPGAADGDGAARGPVCQRAGGAAERPPGSPAGALRRLRADRARACRWGLAWLDLASLRARFPAAVGLRIATGARRR